MHRKDLLALWQKLFDGPANPALRREVIVPILAYRLQENAYGGLKVSAARQLCALVEGERNGSEQSGFPAMRRKVGTRMVREWKGRLHEVSVLPEGYEYNGLTYRSLSVIAREITGTRWSGPAFFGLRQREQEKVE
jgi:hypothetical protein